LNLILVAFVVVYGLVGMRNFELRMANLNEDDGPILYAHVFKNPSLFEGDFQVGAPLSLRTCFKVITSAMVWIPALLWRYLDIDPYITTWIITFLQGTLLGLTVYVLTLAVTRERHTAVLAAVFVYVASPWHWNLANYGNGPDWAFVPYPGNLALPFIMLSLICLFRGRTMIALLLLTISGLIHPTMGLYTCVIVGIYWLSEGFQDRNLSVVRLLVGLAVVGVITILPGLFAQAMMPGDPLPHAEIIAGLSQNGHIVPWSGVSARWGYSWATVLKWLVLATLSWRWRAKFPRNIQRLWLASLMGASLLTLSHVVGVVWQVPTLMNLIGSRSFQVPTLISLPLVVYYWLAHIRSGDWSGGTLSMLCLAVPLYATEYGLIWLLIAGLLLVDISQGHLLVWRFNLPEWGQRSLRAMTLLVFIFWIVAFLTMPSDLSGVSSPLYQVILNLTWGVRDAPPGQLDRAVFVLIVALLGSAAWIVKGLRKGFTSVVTHRQFQDLISWAVIVLLASAFLWVYWENEAQQRSPNALAMLDAQLWARENTPTSSLFVVSGDSWRTMSLRRIFEPFTRESYAYIAARQAKEHRDRLLDFYAISADDAQRWRGKKLLGIERGLFRDFEEDDFLRFASEFGATHLVLDRSKSRQLDLPVVYENEKYAIYSLEP